MNNLRSTVPLFFFAALGARGRASVRGMTRRSLGKVLSFGCAAALAVVLAAGCKSSPSSNSGSLTCQNGTGPESEACDECGQVSCASDHSAVISSCATMVSCIEACQCDANDTCLNGCVSAASASCQGLLTTYADCEKSASACASACTSP